MLHTNINTYTCDKKCDNATSSLSQKLLRSTPPPVIHRTEISTDLKYNYSYAGKAQFIT